MKVTSQTGRALCGVKASPLFYGLAWHESRYCPLAVYIQYELQGSMDIKILNTFHT